MAADTTPLVPPKKRPPQDEKNPVLKMLGKPFKRYGALKVIGILCAGYIACMTFTPIGTFGTIGGLVSPNGFIIDPASEERTKAGVVLWKGSLRTVVAATPLQMVLLAISRCSAFFIYPSLVLVFTTKFRASMEMIAQSPIGMFTYDDLHELHVFCGWVCMTDGCIHTIMHLTRWIVQGNFELVVESRTGLSGLISVICILLVGLPMGWERIRSRIRFETRKYIHYLFVVFCIAMAFHAPISGWPNGGFAPLVFPILILWWALDTMYVCFYMTERIGTSVFHVVPTGVQLTMKVSERFQRNAPDGGYCYINLPWISKTQWHAYSLFENPANPAERQIYMQKLGDWTIDVLGALQRDTHRPVWICGPFSSPYDNAAESDNQILVAGGIGITPAISVMRKHQDSRRSNLIWACRDPHMLEFFVKHGEFSRRGWNMIFYTGKQALYVGDTSEVVTSNGALVHIVRARPNLEDLIPNIIYSIESGEYVPEAFISEIKADAIAQLQEKLDELDELSLTSQQKMTELINYSNDLGFLFTDLMAEIVKDDKNADLLAPTASDGEEKKESNRATMLSKIQGYKSTARMTVRKSMARGTLGPKAGLRSRATATWKAVESGMDTWMEDFEANMFKPWKEDSSEAREYVDSLDRKRVLETWGCLYCGGQGPLANALRKTTKQYGLSVALESFKW